MKLFYILLGATPDGRNTEQHDVFFGIAKNVQDLKDEVNLFWPEAQGEIHMDGYMELKCVDGFQIKVVEKTLYSESNHLYFLNLGGYNANIFQEMHQQMIMVDVALSNVIKRAKKSEFYLEMDIKNGPSHIDDQYGVDIDDLARVDDLLPASMKAKYSIILQKTDKIIPNKVKIGYIKFK